MKLLNENPIRHQDGQEDVVRPESERQRSRGKGKKAETGRRGHGKGMLHRRLAEKQALLSPKPSMVAKSQGRQCACPKLLNTNDRYVGILWNYRSY